MNSQAASASEIVAFWREAGPTRWFEKDEAFDQEIRRRFAGTHERAMTGALDGWESTAEGTLALLLLLDQFPRNMFRGSARAFEGDEKARSIAAAALLKGYDSQVAPELRSFFYLPFEHSEDMADQERAIALYTAAGDEDGLKWAKLHADIIRRFGRFPHRNACLGRETMPEEQKFLDDGGFAG